MAKSFLEMKNQRKSSFDKLAEQLGNISQNKFNNFKRDSDDERFWRPKLDNAGNGYAIIRFLPAPDGEGADYVKYWDHGFKGLTGKWYIEKSLTSLDKPDPVTEYTKKLWDSGKEGEKRVSLGSGKDNPAMKRRLHFIANVYVVQDPANPENNGKVFLFKYGKKIHLKINDAANPKFPDVVKFDPFSLFDDGANFKLKIRQVEGQVNYDASEWDLIEGNDGKKHPRGALTKDDQLSEKIWRSEYKLQPFVAPDQFKTYNELKAKLYQVEGIEDDSRDGSNPQQVSQVANIKSNVSYVVEDHSTPPWEALKEPSHPGVTADLHDDSEDADLSYFQKLANDL